MRRRFRFFPSSEGHCQPLTVAHARKLAARLDAVQIIALTCPVCSITTESTDPNHYCAVGHPRRQMVAHDAHYLTREQLARED